MPLLGKNNNLWNIPCNALALTELLFQLFHSLKIGKPGSDHTLMVRSGKMSHKQNVSETLCHIAK
jgi:hypothetical protein